MLTAWCILDEVIMLGYGRVADVVLGCTIQVVAARHLRTSPVRAIQWGIQTVQNEPRCNRAN